MAKKILFQSPFSQATFLAGFEEFPPFFEYMQKNELFLLPIISLAGRSNVGKSSFINVLMQHGSLARTSKTPGRTRQINIFRFVTKQGDQAIQALIIDLPGHGHAEVSKEMKKRWNTMMDQFFHVFSPLPQHLIIDLQSALDPMQDSDRAFLSYIKDIHPYQCWLLFNKIDKLNQAGRHQLEKKLVEEKRVLKRMAQVYKISCESKEGLQPLAQSLQNFLFQRNQLITRLESQ
jgi:GTP-binding protein